MCDALRVLRMDGKVAFVTGIGSIGPGWGNGRATATLLARQGARVFGVDINEQASVETQRTIEHEGGVCVVESCDMTDGDQVGRAVAACVDTLGSIDVLVNNVGGSAPGGPATMSESEWDAQVALNLKSVFLGCHHVLPVMLAQRAGVIVNLSSVAGIRQHLGRPQAAYSSFAGSLQAITGQETIQWFSNITQ